MGKVFIVLILSLIYFQGRLNGGKNVDLKDVELSGADLRYADLKGADLRDRRYGAQDG